MSALTWRVPSRGQEAGASASPLPPSDVDKRAVSHHWTNNGRSFHCRPRGHDVPGHSPLWETPLTPTAEPRIRNVKGATKSSRDDRPCLSHTGWDFFPGCMFPMSMLLCVGTSFLPECTGSRELVLLCPFSACGALWLGNGGDRLQGSPGVQCVPLGLS